MKLQNPARRIYANTTAADATDTTAADAYAAAATVNANVTTADATTANAYNAYATAVLRKAQGIEQNHSDYGYFFKHDEA